MPWFFADLTPKTSPVSNGETSKLGMPATLCHPGSKNSLRVRSMNFGHWPARGQPSLAVGLCKQHRAFDAEAFLQAIPPAYSCRTSPTAKDPRCCLLLLFAEHNGPVDAKKITHVQRAALLQAGELAADESSLSAQSTSASGICLNVTRRSTASRIWELGTQVKINQQQTNVRRTRDTDRRMGVSACRRRGRFVRIKKK